MAINYEVDQDGDIKKMVLKIMKDHEKFRILTNLRFLFTWRLNDPEYDKESLPIIAIVRKLPTRERDIYAKDLELRIFLDAWQKMSDKQKYRTVFHELLHVNIELDEAFNPIVDDDERVVFKLIPHDIIVRTFQEEIDIFGLPAEYIRTVDVLSQKQKKESVV